MSKNLPNYLKRASASSQPTPRVPLSAATRQQPVSVIDQAAVDAQRRMNDPILRQAAQVQAQAQAQVPGPEQAHGVGRAVSDYFRRIGEDWSENNANFEATNPSIGQRFDRALNPLTMVGPALGAMHDGASAGSFRDMGIAAFQALPIRASLSVIGPLSKEVGKVGNLTASSLRSLGFAGGNVATGVAFDEMQAAEEAKRNGYY